MADFKRRTLFLSSGKQIKLYGNSLSIGKSLEIGEGAAPNIFLCLEGDAEGKTPTSISNPYKLTVDDLQEIADYNLRLWLDFKDNIRKYGIADPKVFNNETPK